jgi:phosphonoacetaldehyde hydrolase
VPTRPREIRLVVLDWAGTTIDFGSCAPAGAFIASFAARGVALTAAEARAPMGLHKRDHVRELLRNPSIAARWRSAVGRDWAEEDVKDLYRDVTPRQLAAVEARSTLTPGVLDCVARLRERGIKVAATTGYFRAAAAAVLAAAKRQGYEPDFAIGADDVPAGRPAPWTLFRAMEALGVYPPAAVVKVGDTPVDVEDGLNAGAWSVAVVDSSSEMGLTEAEFTGLPDAERADRRAAVRGRFLAAGAHAAIDTLAELPVLIDRLNDTLRAGGKP